MLKNALNANCQRQLNTHNNNNTHNSNNNNYNWRKFSLQAKFNLQPTQRPRAEVEKRSGGASNAVKYV